MSQQQRPAPIEAMKQPRQALSALQQYAIVTANYWAFTLTDGEIGRAHV
mgnify:CR=1 FL=1